MEPVNAPHGNSASGVRDDTTKLRSGEVEYQKDYPQLKGVTREQDRQSDPINMVLKQPGYLNPVIGT